MVFLSILSKKEVGGQCRLIICCPGQLRSPKCSKLYQLTPQYLHNKQTNPNKNVQIIKITSSNKKNLNNETEFPQGYLHIAINIPIIKFLSKSNCKEMKKPKKLMDKVQGQDLTKTRKLPTMELKCGLKLSHHT